MSRVGIIANPVSARDIRRIVSHAGNLPINDRANMVLRLLTGLATAGVDEVYVMPEHGGIRIQLLRAIRRAERLGAGRFPSLAWLDMPVTGTAEDSLGAARRMRALGVGAIVVLGGDGTHRVVVSGCGDTPVAGVSTGTNNAFPALREPTVTGLAVGLAVTGQVPGDRAWRDNKQLEVQVNDCRAIALVDVAVVTDRFIGARAIWKPEHFRDLYVTFGAPDGIGMSSIVGLLAPVGREAAEGRRVRLAPPDRAAFTVTAPIAPGRLDTVGIESVETVTPDALYRPGIAAGSLALDGEREMTFCETDTVSIRLRPAAFRTVDVPGCMAHAARHRLLTGAAAARLHAT